MPLTSPIVYSAPEDIILCSTLLLPCLLLIVLAVRVPEFQKSRGIYFAAWLVSLLTIAVCLAADPSWKGLLATLAIEMFLGAGLALRLRKPLTSFLTVVVLLNLVTRPLLSMVLIRFPSLAENNLVWILVAEIAIWFVEGVILASVCRKAVHFGEALAISLILNVGSFGVGLLLPF
jgi:hypothetical protein